MLILVYTDLQAGDGSERRRHDPNTPLQRWRVQKFYAWAAELVQKKGIEAVWDMGDTTHDRSALTHPTIQTVTRGCAQLTRGLPTVTNFKLLGNHEQHLKDPNTHAGNLFSPYFHVVEGTEIFDWPAENLTILCASFSTNIPALEQWLKTTIDSVRSDRRLIVLGHFPVGGAQLSSGPHAQGVNREIFDLADLVLLGHIHRRQKIGRNIHYVGSPFQQDFGEANDPQKCVAILDTETLKLEWVPTPFPVHRTISVAELSRASITEDILRVSVQSPAEAQQLYASPHAGRVEPVYDFKPERGEAAQAVSLDFENLVQAYTTTVSLPGVTPEELVQEAMTLR